MSAMDAYIACNRFGLGAADGELQSATGDARGYLLNQLRNAAIPEGVQADWGGRRALAQRMADRAARKNDVPDTAPEDMPNTANTGIRKVYLQESGARLIAQAQTRQAFIERLVLFWSNHFTVSVQKPIVAALVNRYEVEAIRPHVTGHFHDMVLATARHPAMLMYLDNARSVGPGSKRGERRDKGLNENYARELMELHTLGVGGGYTQDDVIALAKILTGWTLDHNWQYHFLPAAHEPDTKTLLGKTIAEAGEQEGVDAIAMLCAHPATARHIATKLARHFLSDTPAQSDIDAIAKTFRDTNGNLAGVAETLVTLKSAWTHELTKFRDPYQYLIAVHRLTGKRMEDRKGMQALNTLNYRPFSAPSPAGYGDTVADWANPDAVMKRIDWAYAFVQRMPPETDPLVLAQSHLGALSETTAQTIQQAASGKDGLAFLLLSPELQRR